MRTLRALSERLIVCLARGSAFPTAAEVLPQKRRPHVVVRRPVHVDAEPRQNANGPGTRLLGPALQHGSRQPARHLLPDPGSEVPHGHGP